MGARDINLQQRGYSTFDVKTVDDEQRVIIGVATTPSPDRMDDIVEPGGAKFKLPLPLLWQHNSSQPIGRVTRAKVTDAGIEIVAEFVKLAADAPAAMKARIDEAWHSIKSGLVRGLSI